MRAFCTIGISVFTAFYALHASALPGTIEKNVDGDTVWVQATNQPNSWGAKRERLKIRMIGIDAPESHLPAPGGMVGQGDFGNIAADHMAGLAPVGTKVAVEDKGLDKYGRTLARILVKGKDVNLKMIEIGWAIPYIICEGPTCGKTYFGKENVEGYIAACHAAEDAGLGIWDAKNPLKEMPFEFRLRMQHRKPDKYVGNFQTKELYRPADYDQVEVCERIFFKRIIEAKRAVFNPTFRPEEGEEF